MKEREQIYTMLQHGKLNTAQAELLENALKESHHRQAKQKRPEALDIEPPPTKKTWGVILGLFAALFVALVFSTGNKPVFFLLLLLVFSFGCAAAIFLLLFNVLVWKKEDVTRARILILNEVDRKAALVPQIWEAVKAYAKTETDTIENVTATRAAVRPAHLEASAKLDQVLADIHAVVESYPDIKSNQTYAQLFSQLVETENRITAMAAWHNHKVRSFNSIVDSFPFSIVAAAFGFKKAAYHEG